jgi:formylglycine-generating enzyme required for sulfatase activity
VEDCWHGNYEGAPADGRPLVEERCPKRIARGGSWGHNPRDLRVANHGGDAPEYRNFNTGFRVARMLTP